MSLVFQRFAPLADTGANTARRHGLRGLGLLALAPWLAPITTIATLGGCSTAPSGPSSAPWPQPAPRSGAGSAGSLPPAQSSTLPAGNEASQAAMAPQVAMPPIVAEKRWLEEWFGKTPVVISQPSDNTLQLSVPMVNSFDPGQLMPRAALAAVLDRVADSLRRQVNARLAVVAPPDAGTPASQATGRGQRIVEHLVARRVPAQRINSPRVGSPGGPVLLQLQFLPPPIM